MTKHLTFQNFPFFLYFIYLFFWKGYYLLDLAVILSFSPVAQKSSKQAELNKYLFNECELYSELVIITEKYGKNSLKVRFGIRFFHYTRFFQTFYCKIYNKIHCFNHFKVYSSLVLSTLTVLYNHHHCLFPDLFFI